MIWYMDWEFSFLYALQELHGPVLDKIMIFITTLGNSAIYNIGIVFGLICLIPKKTRRMGFQVLISMLCSVIIGNFLLKNLVARVRPCDIDTAVSLIIPHPGEWSFPSGHAMHNMAAAVAIFLNNKKIGIPAILLAVMIGLSRLYHFVHFPTDVLAGFAFAVIVAVLVDIVFRKVKENMDKKKQTA